MTRTARATYQVTKSIVSKSVGDYADVVGEGACRAASVVKVVSGRSTLSLRYALESIGIAADDRSGQNFLGNLRTTDRSLVVNKEAVLGTCPT